MRRQTEWWVVALRLTGLGWYVVACVLLGILGGWWLDTKTGLLPLFTLLGALLGSVIAFWGIYRMVSPLLHENQEKTKDDEEH